MTPRLLFLLAVLLVAFGCESPPRPVADSRLNDYALYDQFGELHRFSSYNDSKGIVLFVQGNGCPIVRNYLEDYRELVQEYGPRGFQFFFLNANIQDDRKGVLKEAEAYDFPVPVLMDQYQLLADRLDVGITAEVFVLHPTTREIMYRGPLNDRLDYEVQRNASMNNYLEDALLTISQGRQVDMPDASVKGCKVTRRSQFEEKGELTYTDDIIPILEKHCVQCHHPNGIGPWAMTDYQTIVGWSDMMEQVLISRRMPPWKADPAIGEFHNSFEMPEDTRRKLLRWIREGMNPGEGEDQLAKTKWPLVQWKGGKPDTIIELKPEILPATGRIPYRFQRFVLDNNADRWLRAIEILPGNPQSLHHLLVTNVSTQAPSDIISRKSQIWGNNMLGVSSLYGDFIPYPENTGISISKGDSLEVQIHYTTTGKPETDVSQIGFYFHPEVPEKELKGFAPMNRKLNLPPYQKYIPVEVTDTIRSGIMVHYLTPHMHYRGKSIKIIAQLPGMPDSTLISVPDFHFSWQQQYKLKEPVYLPPGTAIKVKGHFDNSYQNPLNPDPSQEVKFGLFAENEMFIGIVNYTLVDNDTLTKN
jgi:hypothetical protein